MHYEWRKVLFLKEDIYLDDLLSKEDFDNYFIPDYVQNAIIDFEEFTADKKYYYPILLAGEAGSGKTTLINYLLFNNILKGYAKIINLDRVESIYSILEDLLLILEEYYYEFSNINYDIEHEYFKYEKTIKKLNISERIRFILRSHNKFSRDNKIRNNEKYQNLIIVIDQIDLLERAEIEKRIKKIFSILGESHYIHKIVCSRIETLEICRSLSSSYFATMFRNQIEIEPPKFEEIIKKRLEYVELENEKENTKKAFEKYFIKYKTLQIFDKISSKNIRFSLGIIKDFFRRKPKLIEYPDINYFYDFLFARKYIPNINEFEYLEEGVSIPLTRIVFDTLTIRKNIDTKFLSKINELLFNSLKTSKYSTVVNIENINNSIIDLKKLSLIKESILNSKQYDYTEKGKFLLKLIDLGLYNKKYTFRDKMFYSFSIKF